MRHAPELLCGMLRNHCAAWAVFCSVPPYSRLMSIGAFGMIILQPAQPVFLLCMVTDEGILAVFILRQPLYRPSEFCNADLSFFDAHLFCYAIGLKVPVIGTIIAFILSSIAFATISETSFFGGVGISLLQIIFSTVRVGGIILLFGVSLLELLSEHPSDLNSSGYLVLGIKPVLIG